MKVLYCSPQDRSGLPAALTVGCFILGKCRGAPIYLRAINDKTVLCIALADPRDGEGTHWVGWAMVRPQKMPGVGDIIPDREAVGILCWVRADDVLPCALQLAEEITRGIERSHVKGSFKAAQKMRGEKKF